VTSSGCEQEIITAVGQTPAGQLEARIAAQVIEIVGILIAAGDRQHARAQDIDDIVRRQQRIAAIGDQPGQPLCDPIHRSAAARSITPPSEVRRPPSNAALTFLRPTSGKLNGSVVSSCMAGVAQFDLVNGLVSTPNP
jgi:hypothetical protein